MRGQRRTILHVDLDPFFVSVERALDPSLRGRPVVLGGDPDGRGFVAAASPEALGAGVRVGMPLSQARRLVPDAVFRSGDLAAYGRVSDEVTAVLLAASRRVERPSVDEAFVDVTPESPSSPSPVRAADTVRDELQRRLGLEASLGLASSRLAARVASAWARPRGLLIVLPGHESSFLSPKPTSVLDLPPHLASALGRAGFATLGQIMGSDEAALAAVVGPIAGRLQTAARGDREAPIPVATPPVSLQEEAAIRDLRTGPTAIEDLIDSLARRAARRLRPLRLRAGTLTVEVRRARDSARRGLSLRPPLADENTLASFALSMARPLLEPAGGVHSVLVRLSRLEAAGAQAPLFPEALPLREAR